MPKQPDTGVRVCGEATLDVVSSVIVAVVDGGSGVDVVPGPSFPVGEVVVTLVVPGSNFPVGEVVVTLVVPGSNFPVGEVVVTLVVPGSSFPVGVVVVTLVVPGLNFPVVGVGVEGVSVGVGEADVVDPSAVGVGEADGESVAGSVAVAGAGSVVGPGWTDRDRDRHPGAVSEVVGVAEAESAAVFFF